ncbi:hypothetical protein T484DRAFT_2556161 [Baffinella frigidus]|nr:hypothetical protein T484DRAFT_2556161 [Cryptophyta sp. CCMP2293]
MSSRRMRKSRGATCLPSWTRTLISSVHPVISRRRQPWGCLKPTCNPEASGRGPRWRASTPRSRSCSLPPGRASWTLARGQATWCCRSPTSCPISSRPQRPGGANPGGAGAGCGPSERSVQHGGDRGVWRAVFDRVGAPRLRAGEQCRTGHSDRKRRGVPGIAVLHREAQHTGVWEAGGGAARVSNVGVATGGDGQGDVWPGRCRSRHQPCSWRYPGQGSWGRGGAQLPEGRALQDAGRARQAGVDEGKGLPGVFAAHEGDGGLPKEGPVSGNSGWRGARFFRGGSAAGSGTVSLYMIHSHCTSIVLTPLLRKGRSVRAPRSPFPRPLSVGI